MKPEQTDRIRAQLEDVVSRDEFSGALLLEHSGDVIFEGASGLASRAFLVPNHTKTKFNLGSANKMVTAVAIGQLVEAGRLTFADPVAAHLPDYPREDVARGVTIHHLLTHTSGLGNYFNDRFEGARDRLRSVADYLALFADDPPLFAPGERSDYSNSGYIVLGAIVERTTGLTYDDYVREHIYAPVGMHDTDAYPLDHDTADLAVGYTHISPESEVNLGKWWNNVLTLPARGGPAGGGYSTVEDLMHFARALLRGRLLTPATTDTIMGAKIALQTRAFSHYGYDFCVEPLDTYRIVGHTGGAPGVNAHLDIYPEHDLILTVLVNADPPAATQVANMVRELMTPILTPTQTDAE